jgi:hypothetical protein
MLGWLLTLLQAALSVTAHLWPCMLGTLFVCILWDALLLLLPAVDAGDACC